MRTDIFFRNTFLLATFLVFGPLAWAQCPITPNIVHGAASCPDGTDAFFTITIPDGQGSGTGTIEITGSNSSGLAHIAPPDRTVTFNTNDPGDFTHTFTGFENLETIDYTINAGCGLVSYSTTGDANDLGELTFAGTSFDFPTQCRVSGIYAYRIFFELSGWGNTSTSSNPAASLARRDFVASEGAGRVADNAVMQVYSDATGTNLMRTLDVILGDSSTPETTVRMFVRGLNPGEFVRVVANDASCNTFVSGLIPIDPPPLVLEPTIDTVIAPPLDWGDCTTVSNEYTVSFSGASEVENVLGSISSIYDWCPTGATLNLIYDAAGDGLGGADDITVPMVDTGGNAITNPIVQGTPIDISDYGPGQYYYEGTNSFSGETVAGSFSIDPILGSELDLPFTIEKMHGILTGTNAIHFNGIWDVPDPITVHIAPKDGKTSTSVTEEKLGLLAGTHTINFPITYTYDLNDGLATDYNVIGDLPPDIYVLTFTNGCTPSGTIQTEITLDGQVDDFGGVPVDYDPTFTVTPGCDGEAIIDFNLGDTYNYSAQDLDAILRLGATRVGVVNGSSKIQDGDGEDDFVTLSYTNVPSGVITLVMPHRYLLNTANTRNETQYSAVFDKASPIRSLFRITVPDYEQLNPETTMATCTRDSGFIDITDVPGTAIYPFTHELFLKADLDNGGTDTPVATHTVNEGESLEHTFPLTTAGINSILGGGTVDGVAQEYTLRTSNSCGSMETQITLASALEPIIRVGSNDGADPADPVRACDGQEMLLQLDLDTADFVLEWYTVDPRTDPSAVPVNTGNTDQLTVTANIPDGATLVDGEFPLMYYVKSTTTTDSSCTGTVHYDEITLYVSPLPVLANTLDATVCSEEPSGIVLSELAGSITASSYDITVDVNGLTASAGNPADVLGADANVLMDDAFTNTTGAPVEVIYTVVPYNGTCAGDPVEVVLTVSPQPVGTDEAITVCSHMAMDIPLQDYVNAPSTFTWTAVDNPEITGETLSGTGAALTDTLVNPGQMTQEVTYTITPTYNGDGTCPGDPFELTITVNPEFIGLDTVTSCTGDNNYAVTTSFKGVPPFAITGTGTNATSGTAADTNLVDNGDGSFTWTSNNINVGMDYAITIADANSCNMPLTIEDVSPFCCNNLIGASSGTYTDQDQSGRPTDPDELSYTIRADATEILMFDLRHPLKEEDTLVLVTDSLEGNPVEIVDNGTQLGFRYSATCDCTQDSLQLHLIRESDPDTVCDNIAITIHIVHTQEPLFEQPDLPQDIAVNCNNIPQAPTLTALAACGTATVDFTETRIDGDCLNRYTLVREWTATDNCGVTATHVQRITAFCESTVFGAMSANRDGMNDILRIEGIECYPENRVRVYNRYGNLVFDKEGYNNMDTVFDGTSQGARTIGDDTLPSGAYFYHIEYEFTDNGVDFRTEEQAGTLFITN